MTSPAHTPPTAKVRRIYQRLYRWLIGALALLGMLFALALLLAYVRPDFTRQAESFVYHLLLDRSMASNAGASSMLEPVPLSQISPSQAAVANWLGTRYRIGPEVVARLLLEAGEESRKKKIPAHLILAVMAIESNFHPYVESQAGAQGLMQVMPKVHAQRYEAYGGSAAAFDPVVNLRVGAAVLADCIRLRGGSEQDGLRYYFGGVGTTADDYVDKVQELRARLDAIVAASTTAASPAAKASR